MLLTPGFRVLDTVFAGMMHGRLLSSSCVKQLVLSAPSNLQLLGAHLNALQQEEVIQLLSRNAQLGSKALHQPWLILTPDAHLIACNVVAHSSLCNSAWTSCNQLVRKTML